MSDTFSPTVNVRCATSAEPAGGGGGKYRYYSSAKVCPGSARAETMNTK